MDYVKHWGLWTYMFGDFAYPVSLQVFSDHYIYIDIDEPPFHVAIPIDSVEILGAGSPFNLNVKTEEIHFSYELH